MASRDIAAYLFCAIAWGASFLVIVRVTAAFGWAGAVSFRALVAAATLFAIAAVTRRRLRFAMGVAPLLVVGLTTVALQLVGLHLGTPRVGTAMAAIIIATIPLFSMGLGRVLGIERLSASGLSGLALGFFGIGLLVGFPAQAVTLEFLLGCAALLVACLAAAAGSLYASVRLKDAGPFEVTAGSFLAGGLMTLPLLALEPVPAVPNAVDWLYLALAGAVMSAMTYVTYFGLVARIGATRSVSVEFAVTLVAVLIGWIWLGETLSAPQIAGGALIIAGCALVLGLVRGAQPVRQ